MQIDLFNTDQKSDREVTIETAKLIEGLSLHFEFISATEANELFLLIDANPWLNDLTRRVQHYGYKYDYRARKIDNSSYLGEMPQWLNALSQKLIDANIIDFIPDQAIINEYEPGQGIASHIDCEPCFGDTIISISLGSYCVMNYSKDATSVYKESLLIEPRSLIVMKNDSRYKWYHGIPARKSDKFNDRIIKRQRRVSITFRKVINQ